MLRSSRENCRVPMSSRSSGERGARASRRHGSARQMQAAYGVRRLVSGGLLGPAEVRQDNFYLSSARGSYIGRALLRRGHLEGVLVASERLLVRVLLELGIGKKLLGEGGWREERGAAEAVFRSSPPAAFEEGGSELLQHVAVCKVEPNRLLEGLLGLADAVAPSAQERELGPHCRLPVVAHVGLAQAFLRFNVFGESETRFSGPKPG
mmetsp:Transcript_15880/g.50538  ORF Transcript_15880/g.50538 Transcript_15880/m.50538 type:complete len:208 (-) Transcript_15880:135-758(-)